MKTLAMITLAAAMLVPVGCGGAGSACSSDDDCSGDNYCKGPNEPQVCGIPARTDCANQSGCPGQACNVGYDTCSATEVGTTCGPPCNNDALCGQGFRCGSEGACVAVLCDAGFSCPAHQVCDPSRLNPQAPLYEQHHGCFDIPCSDDAGCSAGLACVNGRCQQSGGFCRQAELIP